MYVVSLAKHKIYWHRDSCLHPVQGRDRAFLVRRYFFLKNLLHRKSAYV
jgi:hypothetical protein